MYPIMLDLEGKRCLVVGGGGVALRKVEGLIDAGAVTRVVAPEAVSALQRLATEQKVELCTRGYRRGEAAEFDLVFAATDSQSVNEQVSTDAQESGIWVNVADQPDLCTFYLPARLRRGDLQISISSEGRAPFAVRRLRKMLEKLFGSEWAEWMEAAGRFRERIRKLNLKGPEENACFERFFSGSIDQERFVVHVPSEEEEKAWIGQRETACDEPREKEMRLVEDDHRQEGLVSLVGAGPGDAGLLTVRGRDRLLRAEAVVFDHLAETVLPCELGPDVELHPVGKRAGYHPVSQDEINALLIRLGRAGKRVVRLKGGDPYVFGRGGEEVESLAEAGIPFEVIPAVTAAMAASNYAGIPVTYRREVVQLSLVTAHETAKKGGPQVRWDLLAQDRHSTLVGYMGVTNLSKVVDRLIEEGMEPCTPAAMIEYGTTSKQRVVKSGLTDLVAAVRNAGIQPPAVFVIGPAVSHAERLDWFGKRPLHGERLVAVDIPTEMREALELAGAEVIPLPVPVTPAAEIVLDALPITGCLMGTPEAVNVVEDLRDRRNWRPDARAVCFGETAGRRALEYGWEKIDIADEDAEPSEVVLCFRADGESGIEADESSRVGGTVHRTVNF